VIVRWRRLPRTTVTAFRSWILRLWSAPAPALPPPAAQNLPPVTLAQVPSLPAIEAELDRGDSSYRERSNSLDTKAGTILSADGVIVALVGIRSSVAGVIGQVFAVVSGAAAIWTLMPRVDKGIAPKQLFDNYLQREEVQTRLKLLATKLPMQVKNEARLFVKAQRLKLAAGLLLASAAAIVVGGILNDIWH
jgi:hypothetical protein